MQFQDQSSDFCPKSEDNHKHGSPDAACGNTNPTSKRTATNFPAGEEFPIIHKVFDVLKSMEHRLRAIERCVSSQELAEVLSKSNYSCNEVSELTQCFGIQNTDLSRSDLPVKTGVFRRPRKFKAANGEFRDPLFSGSCTKAFHPSVVDGSFTAAWLRSSTSTLHGFCPPETGADSVAAFPQFDVP